MELNTLSTRISAGFVLAFVIPAAIVITALFQLAELERSSTHFSSNELTSVKHMQALRSNFEDSKLELKSWMAGGGQQHLQGRREAWQNIDESLFKIKRLSLSALNRDQVVRLEEKLGEARLVQQKIEAVAQTEENFPGLQILFNQAMPRAERIQNAVTLLIEREEELAAGEQRKQLLKHLADFRASFASAMSAAKAFLLSNQESYFRDFEEYHSWHEDAWLNVQQQQALLDEQQIMQFQKITRLRVEYWGLVRDMFEFRRSANWDQAESIWQEQLGPLTRALKNQLIEIEIAQQRLADNSLMSNQQSLAELSLFSVIALVLAAVITTFIAYLINKQIGQSVSQSIEVAEQVADGDFSTNVQLQGSIEIVRLSKSLSRMTETLRAITQHVKLIENGYYQTDFVPKGEQDQLGKALDSMTKKLRESKLQLESQSWLKAGLSEFSDLLTGARTVTDIYQASVDFCTKHTGAEVGVLYAKEGGGFKLVSSFAYKHRNSASNEFMAGEGLAGQAVLEGKVMCFSDLPADHIPLEIESGLGHSAAKFIVAVPLVDRLQNGAVLGVLLLGNTKPFKAIDIEWLEQSADKQAQALTSAQSRGRLQELLEESQQQAEELESQQQDLKAANEELEQQTQELKRSEEELREQRSQLTQTNTELTERTDTLQKQKIEIENARIELQHRAEQLAVSSKYKSEFLANMSHELRTPLNSLLLLSQSLARNSEGNLTQDQLEDIEVIYNGGQSLLTLINEILDLSKVEAGKLKLISDRVDLHSFVARLKRQFDPVAKEKNLEFKITVSALAPKDIETDELRLEQVLRNLLSNAFKFTEQGYVELCIEPVAGDVRFSSSTLTPDNSLSFVVRDTGIGIEQGMQKAIFEAFQQADGSTSRAFGGTGLGLTVSREFSLLLGGEIQLVSEVNKGSTFSLYIPRHKQPDHEEQGEPQSQPDLPANQVAQQNDFVKAHDDALLAEQQSLSADVMVTTDVRPASAPERNSTILIVEDDSQFASILSDIARKHQFDPLVCSQAEQALNMIQQALPSAVILDIGLPDMDGMMLLDTLKSEPKTRQIPVHIVSGKNKDPKALQKGAIDFLTKPVSLEQLEQVFAKFEVLLQKHIKHLLLVEDDTDACKVIKQVLQQKGLELHVANDGGTAMQVLKQHQIDCCIVDLNLPDISGFELLERMDAESGLTLPPIIVYTAQDLSRDEYHQLLRFTDKIVLKTDHAPVRLQDEVELFLHSVEQQLPPSVIASKQNDIISQPVDLSGFHVLLVDDDLRNTYALSKLLKEQGLAVTMADNGQLALEKLQQSEQFDLVLMDIMMPVMDGFEAMRHIRADISQSLPIIALTAKAMSEDKQKCLEAGASDYLAKPVDINVLISMMKIWLYETQNASDRLH
ncbi:histidine kinase [Pseudoalteromonas rubra]|uniref:histidine kinase n=1 Tax=Pseudoalteromonas rubra TaxID=43658 RepID=A0A5S3WK87_9GAMM|nr:response regulator [Pseudoalteromonas rubra]TMP26859.1 histidine kinase [Pseudoalteromonas rubra]TMP33756.1 histidine kinase [Pseudoalteromonas rubra]